MTEPFARGLRPLGRSSFETVEQAGAELPPAEDQQGRVWIEAPQE